MEQSNNVGLKSRFWVLKKCKNVFSITAVHNFIYTTTNNFSVVNLLRKEHICPLMAISLNSKRTVFLQLVIIVLVGMFFLQFVCRQVLLKDRYVRNIIAQTTT